MTEITVPVMKTVSFQVQNGEMKIRKVDDAYVLEYHNHIYVGNPFRVPTQFSTDFTIEQIMRSSEVIKFLGRFD